MITQRGENAQVVSLVTGRKQVGNEQLQLLKVRLKVFSTVLEQKLLSADPGTKMLCTPVQQIVHDVLAGPEIAVTPDNNLYQDVESIMAEISKDPILAMAHEKALCLTD